MIRLKIGTEPRWLDMPHGVRVRVRPLTTIIDHGATADARRRVAAESIEAEAAAEAGQPLDADGFTAANGAVLEGRVLQYKVEALARFGILEWEGLAGEGGQPLPLSRAAIVAFAAHPDFSMAFLLGYRGEVEQIEQEGNGSKASSGGATAAARPSAKAARRRPAVARASRAGKPAGRART